MSAADIDRLLASRDIVRESFDDAQVAGYWAKSHASLVSSRIDGLSRDAAFQLAYTAALQGALAVLGAHDLRVRSTGNHYMAFYVLQKLAPALREPGIRLDALRMTRHQSVYEPDQDDDDMERRLDRALETLQSSMPVLREAILAVRPTLVPRLPVIR